MISFTGKGWIPNMATPDLMISKQVGAVFGFLSPSFESMNVQATVGSLISINFRISCFPVSNRVNHDGNWHRARVIKCIQKCTHGPLLAVEVFAGKDLSTIFINSLSMWFSVMDGSPRSAKDRAASNPASRAPAFESAVIFVNQGPMNICKYIQLQRKTMGERI